MHGFEERQVLQAIVQAGRRRGDFITVNEIARATNLADEVVQRALRTLSSHGDRFFRSALEPDGRTVVYVSHVTVHAQRAAEGLPSDLDATDEVPVSPSRKRRLASHVVKVVGATVVAIAAKTIATFVTDAIHRP
ncbi:hypothetical protein AB0L34_25745 [Micromonospora sp. NPDC052213]|uniref:hypothetical protein n=1 Tax=Micromonospora sp. NPDC052213 TaxID=3155812 RepID=UPI00341B390C